MEAGVLSQRAAQSPPPFPPFLLLLPHTDLCLPPYPRYFQALVRLIDLDDDLSADRSHMRLAAAKALLRYVRVWGVYGMCVGWGKLWISVGYA